MVPSNLRKRLTMVSRVSVPKNLRAWDWAVLLGATCLGIGFSPLVPATVASAATAAAALFLAPHLSTLHLLAAVVLLTLAAGPLAAATERLLQTSDPKMFVLDEVAGQLLVFAFHEINLRTVVLGFLLFRVFDVVKLPPADALEKVGRGWGVVLDDLAAGIYANLALGALLWLVSRM